MCITVKNEPTTIAQITKRENNLAYCAAIRYILFRCCKRMKEEYQLGEDIVGWETSVRTVYKPIKYMDLKWIVDRCNFENAKNYGLPFISYDYFSWEDDNEKLVPEWYNCDFATYYKVLKNNKIKKIADYNKEEDWLSECEKETMNKVIRRWKLYGHICQSISDWWWIHVTSKLRKKKA